MIIKRKWASELETYAAAGHRFSQHMLFVLAVAFYRRHSSLGKCQGSFFIISSEIIKFLSSVGTHIPQDFCTQFFPHRGSERA